MRDVVRPRVTGDYRALPRIGGDFLCPNVDTEVKCQPVRAVGLVIET